MSALAAIPAIPVAAALASAAAPQRAGLRWQSALAPAGRQALHIDGLWDLLFWVSTAVFVLVMLALLAGIMVARRRRHEAGAAGEGSPAEQRAAAAGEPADPRFERRAHRVIAGAVAVSALVLIGLLVASVGTGRAIAELSDPQAPKIRITGHQWWWEVEYQDAVPARSFLTANEIHLPVGRPVQLEMTSRDVIHSFWVPNLHGKMDLIPARTNHLWIEADRPGVYRGQCAEFCGLQHAHMSLLVVAEPPAEFEAWRERQRQPAAPPSDPVRAHGERLFESGPCVLCHAVRGSQAGSRNGPDLTHVASRRTLAAATLDNRRGQLAGWILDPQHAKPGNRMPPTDLSSEELRSLLAYLEGLR